MSRSASWKNYSLFLSAIACLLLAAPARAGVLDDLRETSAHARPLKETRAQKRMSQRRAALAAQAKREAEEADDEDDWRFGAEPDQRDYGRTPSQAEPANWQPGSRRSWFGPEEDIMEPAEDQDRMAAVEPQPVEQEPDQATVNRQNWDENNQAWTDTDEGTRPIPRQEVVLDTREAPGTIIINTEERRLYFILGDNRAMQYGIGVGKPGFEWAGVKSVTRKEEWPDWRPPEVMIRRRPDLPRFMPGGPTNPLGARAMYLGSSLYRIHGSNEPATIGQAVSSGCIRMINADVIDLYNRVKVGTKVVVR